MIFLRLNRIIFFLAILLTACSAHNHAEDNHASSHAVPDKEHISHDHSETAESDAHEDSKNHNDRSIIRSADSHAHGGAQLAFALDGNIITAEFDTPLYNLLGFEHAPDTQVQKTHVKDAEIHLSRGQDLFNFNQQAACRFTPQNEPIKLFPDIFDKDHHEDGDTHDEGRHEDDEHHEADHDDTHKDIILRYAFSCKHPDKLINVNLNLFEFFDELSEIDVTYLGPSVQKQLELSRENTKMNLKP